MFAKIPYPHSCEHMHCEHRQDGICILQNTRDNRGKIIGCDRGETRLMYENGKIPITNADRIRGMSDEELAKELTRNPPIPCRVCEYYNHKHANCGAPNGFVCVTEYAEALTLDWLQQPAETEGTK